MARLRPSRREGLPTGHKPPRLARFTQPCMPLGVVSGVLKGPARSRTVIAEP